MVTATAAPERTWIAQRRQREFLHATEDEVLYGGSAGGGKSDGLLIFNIMRRTKNPGSKGLFIRRTYAELSKSGSAIPRSQELLSGLARWDGQEHKWRFPNGSVLEFGYLESDVDKYRYQSAQYDDVCVAQGTPVLMADGSSVAIEQLKVGDMVMTLEGARPVQRVFPGRVAACVKAKVYDAAGQFVGSQVHPFDHPILTPNGWRSAADIIDASHPSSTFAPTRTLAPCISSLPSLQRYQLCGRKSEGQSRSRPLLGELFLSFVDRSDRRATFASVTDRESDFAVSDGSRPAVLPLALWSAPVVLHARSARQARRDCQGRDGAYAPEYWRITQGWSGRCASYSGRDDGPLRSRLGSVLACPPSPGGVASQNLSCCTPDELVHTPKYTPRCSATYIHPYTLETRSVSEDVEVGSCVLTPAGDHVVYDVTVASANHYITSSTGLSNKNCFDELTQLQEDQYLYLVGRARTVRADLKPLIRAATNPGGVGHVWVKRRFVDVAPPGTTYVDGETGRTRRFIPARVQDNTALMQADPGYVLRLQQLPEAERRALLDGDWDVFSGQAFAEWRRALHVCEPFVVPADWPHWISVDSGYEHPFVCLWWTRSRENGRYYVYREVVRSKLIDSQQAALVMLLSGGERLVGRWADPAMWQKRSDSGISSAKRYEDVGLFMRPGMNNRTQGRKRVHDLLALAEDGWPHVQIFSTCTSLIACLPTMVVDEHDIEDVRKVDGDDAYDAFRYGAPQVTRTTQGTLTLSVGIR